MFTGIIEEVGTLKSIQRKNHAICLTLSAYEILKDIKLGDSIAVNGICLTVTSFTDTDFSVDVMQETLSRTSLSSLKDGGKVNLERAMPMNGRFGGHIVTGHIDGTGTITQIRKDSIAVWYTIKTTQTIMRYIIDKGSIAIDGISLTIAKVSQDDFSVSIIPHTIENTILSSKKVNELVNLENDCIGKYVERLVLNEDKKESGITRDFLAKLGY